MASVWRAEWRKRQEGLLQCALSSLTLCLKCELESTLFELVWYTSLKGNIFLMLISGQLSGFWRVGDSQGQVDGVVVSCFLQLKEAVLHCFQPHIVPCLQKSVCLNFLNLPRVPLLVVSQDLACLLGLHQTLLYLPTSFQSPGCGYHPSVVSHHFPRVFLFVKW